MKTKFLEYLAVTIGMLGLVIGMSEGPWFPWVNLGGIAVLVMVGLVSGAAGPYRTKGR